MISNNNNKGSINIGKRFYLLAILLLAFIVYQVYIFNKTVECVIFYTNDLEGQIYPSKVSYNNQLKEIGGFSALSSFLKTQNDPYILLDTGNTIFGTPESDVSKGKIIVELMNHIGYTALGLGNYELEYGKKNLSYLAETANFHLISTNIIDKTTKDLIPNLVPYMVKEMNSVKFGIISVVCPMTLESNLTGSICDIDMKPIFQTIREYVKILKEREKVDFVIMLSRFPTNISDKPFNYDENKCFDIDNTLIAKEVSGIDVIIASNENSNNQSIYLEEKNKTIICYTQGKGLSIGKLKLTVRQKTKKLVTFNNEIIDLWNDTYYKDPEIEKLIKELYLKNYDSIIGRTNINLYKNYKYSKEYNFKHFMIGDLIALVMRDVLNTDIAFFVNRDLKSDIKIGKISYRTIYNALPFNDTIYIGEMTGADIKELLEISNSKGMDYFVHSAGINYFYNFKSPLYNRIFNLSYKYGKIDLNKKYKIAVTERMLNYKTKSDIYKKGNFKSIPYYKIRDIIINYISTHVPLDEDEIKKLLK
jgi:5'-nucleotidase / UDP-sugar diphosphatase